MLITYRRTGGLFALLTFVAVALTATVLTVAVAGVVLIVAVAIAALALVVRAVLPRSWWRRKAPAATAWPYETIEGTVVKPTVPSDRDRLPIDRDTPKPHRGND